MTFQIIRLVAVEHPIYGGVCGSKAVSLPMSYHSEALAHKLAGVFTERDYEACGDDHFVVVPYGTDWTVWNRYTPAATIAADDMPF